ncbi:hypothetical protein GGF37_005347 [Kickxella alabastrina]|nr:hypothetical protein GGF37_005347 [Kickxella alabastrina]
MSVKVVPMRLPPAIVSLLAPFIRHLGFSESMLPSIIAVRKPNNRIHFMGSEDSLLLEGLRLFGPEDVASMSAHLMPCKTEAQLRNRLNNLRARRAHSNPVKAFCLRRIAPFTLEEEEILRLSVVVYGEEFNQFDQDHFVNRPVLALTHVWSHLRKADSG